MTNTTYFEAPISQIVENPDALRTVDREREDYINLRDSIASRGIIQPIAVRRAPDDPERFILIDGAHRYTAAKECGLETIPVRVMDATPTESYELQMITNLHQVATKPAEYAKQLQRILSNNLMLTIPELAALVHKSPAWLQGRLRLTKLHDEVQKLVDDGNITVYNGMQLASLPVEEQLQWVDRAMTQAAADFQAAIKERVTEIRKAKREGRDANATNEFVAAPRARKLGELKEALDNADLISSIIGDASDVVVAARRTLRWSMRMDNESVAAAKAEYDARVKLAEEKKAKAKLERTEKRAAEALKAKEEAIAAAEKASVA